MAVHALAGGRRIVERLGPDDTDIQFRGIFSGSTAETRARAFDDLRLSGQIVWLTWESFRRPVVVKSFTADYFSPWWIAYQVSCLVVHQARIYSPQAINMAASLSADLASAISAATGTATSLAAVQTALSATNALTPGSGDQIQATVAIGSTLSAVNNQIGQQSATLVTPIPSSTGVADLGQSYVSKVNCAASLAAMVNVSSYIGRIGVNIAGASN